MKTRKIPIYKFTYFILLAFLEPDVVTQIGVLDNLYLAWKIIASILIVLFICWWNKNISKLSIIMGIYWFSFIVSTIINNGDLTKAIKTILSIYPIILYLDFSFSTNAKYTMKSLYKIFLVYFYINFLLQIVYPEGFGKFITGYQSGVDWRLNFLGKDNSMLFFMITFIILSYIYNYKNKRKFNFHLILTVIYMIVIWSGTGLIGISIVALGIFLIEKYGKVSSILNFKTITISYILIYYSIVIVRIQEYFSGFIVGILNKDITFTGRTYLWDLSIQMIKNNLLFGMGITTEKYLTAQSGISYSPHNMFLQMVLNGGVMSLIIFLIMMLFVTRKFKCIKNKKLKSIFAITIFSYLIGGLTESTVNVLYLYFILVIGFNLNKLNFYFKEE